ncbi:response regulator transcription factor [Actinomycetaceae bacterium MB13-C1-2]|nr:response regulator transcription factor [Actinomycetaceae bacterium MB13-C1-2]
MKNDHELPWKLLVVDDEPNIRDLLASSLRFAGFSVTTAGDGATALDLVQRDAPDLIVLDVMLPDISGFEITEKLRASGVQTPVLFLTARDDTRDKVEGLNAGGDDYVTKPFGLEEVVARIHAILRRTIGEPEEAGILRVADVEIDENAHEVHRAGIPVDLSPTEFRLLRYLAINYGRVVSKMQILDYVWQYDWGGDAAIVESYISYVRKKLAVKPDLPELIHTRRGVGYIMRENS